MRNKIIFAFILVLLIAVLLSQFSKPDLETSTINQEISATTSELSEQVELQVAKQDTETPLQAPLEQAASVESKNMPLSTTKKTRTGVKNSTTDTMEKLLEQLVDDEDITKHVQSAIDKHENDDRPISEQGVGLYDDLQASMNNLEFQQKLQEQGFTLNDISCKSSSCKMVFGNDNNVDLNDMGVRTGMEFLIMDALVSQGLYDSDSLGGSTIDENNNLVLYHTWPEGD